MRNAVLLVALLAVASASAASDMTSRELIGTWFGGTSSQGDRRFTFRADHTFDGIDGDAISAGKWKLHGGNKLELIYYSDYERKIISRSSKRGWIVIKPVTTNRIEMAYFDKDFSPGFQLASAGVWTKQR
jgi:hypothetical protein